MLHRLTLLIASLISLFGATPPNHAQSAKPSRTAIITSSGVNGDRRSWSEYDNRLRRSSDRATG